MSENNKKLDRLDFPNSFMWGASTSSHQIEGGTYNQWTVFELENAAELAKTAKDRLNWLPDWDKFKVVAERPDNYISGDGVDHYNRYKEDFKILKKLNLNSFRFGIEWSRLQPEEGKWDESSIEHYRGYIKELRKLDIEPILNLWHWTQPVWFENKGGFTKGQNLRYFVEFAKRIAHEYGDDLKYILTINEPNVYTGFSFVIGEWPPCRKNIIEAFLVYRNLAKAHNLTYKAMKAKAPHLQIGAAIQYSNAKPSRPNSLVDKLSSRINNYGWNWWWTNRIKSNMDFVGFNHYFTDYWQGFTRKNPAEPHNDLGWYMEPSGIKDVINEAWSRYGKPIMITENGVADQDDSFRQWWIEETMLAIGQAISMGSDVVGYMHWSLLDNFEWKYGWWPKFGLVEVDRSNNMKRNIRPSALWWADRLKRLSAPEKSK